MAPTSTASAQKSGRKGAVTRQVKAKGKTSGAAERLGAAHRAYAAGEYGQALRLARKLDTAPLRNRDYADYLVAQSAYLSGDFALAKRRFAGLAGSRTSRFAAMARWRAVDCDWRLGRVEPAREAYERLLKSRGRRNRDDVDLALVRFRVAEAYAAAGKSDLARTRFRRVWEQHPAHPLAERALQRARTLGEPESVTAADRIARADLLTEARLWREAIAELDRIGDHVDEATRYRRDFQMGRTLYKMRRQYELAGRLLLAVYPHLSGDDAVWAMFHGARALSRAHLDGEAIPWYRKLVAEYPRSEWAGEAQYLSGWLEFNRGNLRECLAPLAAMNTRYPRSRWASWAAWYRGLALFLLGEYDSALPLFADLARGSDRLEGGRGSYWHARSLQQLGRSAEATAEYRALVGRFPFAWYALLARTRLAELGVTVGPFGDPPARARSVPEIATTPERAQLSDPLIRSVDELIAADMGTAASYELRRGERAFLKRHPRPLALAAVLDRYRRAGDFNRPWMLAVVRGASALESEPKGAARTWWEHAYPLAYDSLVESYRELGSSPRYYLQSIMRKESGFDPNTVSYADALGLLQMIPPTTRRVADALGLSYTDDMLYDPELNIKVGSWYIGRLLHKFKNQIPIGAASYNAGPGPVIRWLAAYGEHPIDEYVELVSYRQAREYGKKVTETYARYLYLYAGQVYDQPLTLDPNYVVDRLDY